MTVNMNIKRGEPFQTLSRSPETTRSIGHSLGKSLARGDTVFIYGDIGAGKTVFVGGMASALNVGANVSSPTFIIANVYDGVIPLYHFDAYRIESPAELFETGFFEYAGGDCVVAVEWASRIEKFKPDGCIEVWIGPVGDSETDREIKIVFL